MPWISAQERVDFRACRRRWDCSSTNRRNLEPAAQWRACDLDRAVKDALAVYYFPGMWDWPRAVVLPLVLKGFERAVADQKARVVVDAALTEREQADWSEAATVGRRILEWYATAAPALDHFAPVLVETEFAAPVPDPARPECGLLTAAGAGVNYTGRVDLLAVDEYDAYWIVRHKLVEHWTSVEQLAADDVASAACWAWAQFYLGMTITGTIDNELRARPPTGDASVAGTTPRRVAQSEGSGGGRSIPQHRRMSAQAMEPVTAAAIEIQEAAGVRRVWVRRRREDVDLVAAQVAADLAAMVDVATPTPASPGPGQCAQCAFLRPCLEMMDGRSSEDALAVGYRPKLREPAASGRLGAVTWSIGRGAAPPRLGPDER